MHIERLSTVDGFVAFDLDDSPINAGGTRYAPDVTEEEAALLARAMTYKFGVLRRQVGGAKGGVRGTADEKPDAMARYCDEIRPLVQSSKFLTGPDLGTSESDFSLLRDPSRGQSIMATDIGGVPVEDLLTGFGVVVAAETALGSLEGMAIAIEGFGKVGGGVAKEAVRRGALVVAVSTLDGCVVDGRGLDVELMLELRREHGDGVVKQLFSTFDPDPRSLLDVEAEVLVPGARTGVISADVAQRLRSRWLAPAANVPYASDALPVMRERRVRYLPDFICNAGATIGYTSDATTHAELFRHVEDTISSLMAEAGAYPSGPFEGGCAIAARYIETWRGPDGMPAGPPLA